MLKIHLLRCGYHTLSLQIGLFYLNHQNYIQKNLQKNVLSIYLEKIGKNEETARHHLAAGIYYLASGRGDHLKRWMNNLKIRLNRATGSNTPYSLPRVTELISLPEFEALNRFLTQYGVDVGELQGKIDELVAQARNAPEGS